MAAKYVKPTESELEILNIIWEKNLATVRDVHEELAKIQRCRIHHYIETHADHA